MSEHTPVHHLKRATAAYQGAHETIRAHAARLKAERWAVINEGAKDSQAIDAAAAAGVIRAGSTLDPKAPA